MNNNGLVIVITGESGSGKSYIQRNLLSKYPNIDIITKYTSRNSRIDENNVVDTVGGISIDEIRKMEYTYRNPLNQEMYGFIKQSIDRSLAMKKIPCMALSDEGAYNKVLEDYPNTLLLKVVPYYNEEIMKEVFQKQERSDKEFLERKQVIEHPLTAWTTNYENIREVINPYFVRNISLEMSNDVIFRRVESILEGELNQDLGASYSTGIPSGVYSYLYGYSKNRPKDRELTIVLEKHVK